MAAILKSIHGEEGQLAKVFVKVLDRGEAKAIATGAHGARQRSTE